MPEEFWQGKADIIGEINMLTGSLHLEAFGDESVMAFDRWAERCCDYLEAFGGKWTEAEKISRIRLALTGTPRQLFKQLTAAELQTADGTLKALRFKLDSPQRREITKRTLAICKQRENETISDFIKRLTPLVEVVNSSLNDSQRKEKLCEEFLERVHPNMGFLIRLVGLSKTKDLDVVIAQAEELETLLITQKGEFPESLKQSVSALNLTSQPRFSVSNYTSLDGVSDQSNSRDSHYRPSSPNHNDYYQQDYGNFQQHNEQRRNKQMICDYCGRRGHTANFCYKRQNQYQQSSSQFDNQRDSRQQMDPLECMGTKVDLGEVIRALVGIKLQEGNEQSSNTTKRGSLDHVDSLVTVSPKVEIKPKINQSCLIDTGATLTMAPMSVARKIKCRLHPTESEAVSSSGHSILFLQQGEAVLKIAEQVVPVLINFVDDGQFNMASGYEIVLGCDVLKRLPKDNCAIAIINSSGIDISESFSPIGIAATLKEQWSRSCTENPEHNAKM